MAGSPDAAYNADMSRRKSWGLATALSLMAAVCALIPYGLAVEAVEPDLTFSGFLINPHDGFSYLAKMRQGAQGAWGFVLPYAADPGEPAFLFVHYLALGQLARWFGIPLPQMYHAARLIGTLLMYLASFALLERYMQQAWARWGAFGLILFGSGLGWLGLPFGVWGIDLLVPEAVPWFSALVNAHFPLASAALLGLWIALGDRQAWLPRRMLLAGGCALALALMQPFALLTPALAAPLWMLLERRGTLRQRLAAGMRSHTAAVLGAMLLSSLPLLLYEFWITRIHPALRAWSLQNLTPAPAVWATALGYGVPLLLAALAVWRSPRLHSPEGRMLLCWFVVGLILVYLPFPLQRRMLLGLFFPLAGLAGWGLAWLAQRDVRLLPVLGLALACALPSNLAVAAAGVIAAAQGDPAVTVPPGTLQAYGWLARAAKPGALVLAGPLNGNRLPAYAGLHVLYGHPFETPDAAIARAEVEAFYAGDADPELGLRALRERGVDFVLYSPEERSLGSPAWLEGMHPAFQSGETAVYRVSAP